MPELVSKRIRTQGGRKSRGQDHYSERTESLLREDQTEIPAILDYLESR